MTKLIYKSNTVVIHNIHAINIKRVKSIVYNELVFTNCFYYSTYIFNLSFNRTYTVFIILHIKLYIFNLSFNRAYIYLD